MTTERYSMARVAADGYRAMGTLQQFVDGSSLSHRLLELVKMHASQLNHCAYCLDMHSKDAVALGVPAEQLFLLNAWHEATCYDERERAALAWTEELTLIAESGASDAAYAAAREPTAIYPASEQAPSAD